jgi:hypothetical protein
MVVVVDVGEVAQLRRRQAFLYAHEPHSPRCGAEPGEAVGEQRSVRAADLPYRHRRPVTQHDQPALFASVRPGRMTPRPGPGDQRGHAGPVSGVGIAQALDQVVFFECDAGQDVAGRGGREQQVPGRHHRRRPEHDDEPGHQRMPDAPVHAALGERRGAVPDTSRMQPGLPQPEQVEMADQEGGADGYGPAGRIPGPQRAGARSGQAPDGPPDRPPQPEHQRQYQARGQDETRPFGRLWHEARPAALEPRPGHHGVLNREQQQQEQVDAHRGRRGGVRPPVDARGHAKTREEARRVAEHHQEEQVHRCRVRQDDQCGHAGLLRAPGYRKAGWVRGM